MLVTGRPSTDDVFALAAARAAFGGTMLVTITSDGEPVVAPPGVEVVAVDASHPFAIGWDSTVARLTRSRR